MYIYDNIWQNSSYNISDRSYRENQIIFQYFSPENCADCDKMWKKLDTARQATIVNVTDTQKKRFACRITKARKQTHTYNN